jgi:serine/threonine-protein kinase
MQVRDLTAAQFARLCELLDESIDLAPLAREEWLSRLENDEPQSAELLRRMFSSQAATGADVWLETRSLLNRHLAALAPEGPSLAGRRIGPYRVLSLLGHGGMGSVWLAERADGLFTRQVALKLIHPALMSGTVTERFAREREILASLDHPHIARMYDAGLADDGQPYLALQYVVGQPITSYCDDRRLGVRARLELYLQVLGAVQYAHANLVIHRDLKPSNILVTAAGQVHLLDFGIAKLLSNGAPAETALTRFGARALTPEYAAPEQVTGGAVTTAVDVYSLGVILCELLTGERPYRLKYPSPGALEEAIVTAEPARPSHVSLQAEAAARRGTSVNSLRRALRGDLDTVVLKTLEKLPSRRYATADALARDIRSHLAGEPLTARSDGFWRWSVRFVRRHRLAAGAALAIVAGLSVGLGIAIVQAQRAIEEARVARDVQRFLQDVFEANSKDQKNPLAGQLTTARELLDRGAAKIDQTLRDSPRAQWEVMDTLVRMYHDLGVDEKAVELARRRVTLATQLFGPTDRRVAQAMRDLSLSVPASSAATEQSRIAQEALAILDRNGDSNSVLRANLLGDLAQHYAEYDLPKALDYTEQSVRVLRRYPASTDLKDGLELLGVVHTQMGNYAKAEPVLTEAIQLSRRLQGDPNAHLPALYAYLAEAQYFQQSLANAESSYRQGYGIASALEGEAAVDTLQLGARLGQFLCRIGRAREGLTYLERADNVVSQTLPADDPLNAPMIIELYGWELAEYGPLESGMQRLAQATTLWRKTRPLSAYMLSALERSADVLIDLGQYAEAQALVDEAAAIRARAHDETTHPNGDVAARAKLLLALGRPDEAESTLAHYRVQSPPPGGVSLTALDRSLDLAEVALARDDFAKARELAEQVELTILRSKSRTYLKRYEARANLDWGLAMIDLHDPDHAVPALKQAVQSHSALYDPRTSVRLASAELALARALAATGKAGEARLAMAEADAIQGRHAMLGEHLRKPLDLMRRQLSGN